MTFPASRHAALASLALAIITPAAFADGTASISTVNVTATRSAQPASELLNDTVSIGAEEIARTGAGSVLDVLQRQRGIEITRNGGAGATGDVYIRGASSNQSIVLVDGVRIGSSSTGAANWRAIPVTAINHIEIVYGPLSTLYGADAIGGVIQIFTKQGAGPAAVSAFVGAGGATTREYDASISGASDSEHSVSYALSAGKERSGGFSATRPDLSSYNPDDDGYEKENAAGRLGLQVANGHQVGLLFLQSRLKAQYDSGLSAFDTRTLQKLENLALFSKNQILPDWSSQLQASQSRDTSLTLTSAAASGRSGIRTEQTGFSWQSDIRLGPDALQLLLEHRKEAVLSNSSPQLTRERSTRSLAAFYNMKRGAHLASISARSDDSAQYGSKATGAIGYGYRFTSALRASASYATSFRAPTFNELYFPGFGISTNQPEQGRNAETALRFDDGTTRLEAVYYRNRLTDLLVTSMPCPFDAKLYTSGCAYNVNQARLEGLSLSGARRLGDFSLSADIDLQDPKDETSGKQLARRAQRHANLALDYAHRALRGGVEVHFSGRRFDDAANRNALGGYGVLNLHATYQLARDWSALVRLNNVANKQYDLARFYATAGRTVFAGLRYGFK